MPLSHTSPTYQVGTYQVGGSLPGDAASYVVRAADETFFTALKSGEYCYVLNARQMGKSSLRVRTMQRLQATGVTCGFVDLSGIGRQGVDAERWYAGLISALVSSCQIGQQVDWRTWWRSHKDILSPVQRFQLFIDEILLTQITGNLVLFIDEIDRILSQQFCLDDFFALIRSFYNARVDNPNYQRLTISFLGVADPSDLILDKTQTPFNIGRSISLVGFTLAEAQPLLSGLAGHVSNPQETLAAILEWTGGQPFLTQKVCQLVTQAEDSATVDELVKQQIIGNWQSQDEPEHLRTIRDRICRRENRTSRLLGEYQTLLQNSSIPADNSPTQAELLLSGLVIKRAGQLTVANKIYQQVFTPSWIQSTLKTVRPYRENITAWLESDRTDESRLLQGQALQDAITWRTDKQLSPEDNAFLSASQDYDKQLIQQQLTAEQQAKQVLEDAQKVAQQKIAEANRRLNIGSAVMALFLILSAISGTIATRVIAQARRERDELRLVSQSIEADRTLDESPFRSLLTALETAHQFQQLNPPPAENSDTATQVSHALSQALMHSREFNQLDGHEGRVIGVQFSPDSQLIASASEDNTVKLWTRDGEYIRTFLGHKDNVWSVQFSPDGKTLASASRDSTIKLWETHSGRLLKTLEHPNREIRSVDFSADGRLLAASNRSGEVVLWKTTDGTRLRTIDAHPNRWANAVVFHPSGELMASASQDRTVKLWQVETGKLVRSFKTNALVRDVAFSTDGKQMVSSGEDGNVVVWDVETGEREKTFSQHSSVVWDAKFVPKLADAAIVSASDDETLKLWNLEQSNRELQTFVGHQGPVRSLSFSPDGQTMASAGTDRTVRLWKIGGPLPTSLVAHDFRKVWTIQFSPDGQHFATTGGDGFLKLWRTRDLSLVRSHLTHRGLQSIQFSPDGQYIAAAGRNHGKNNTVEVWRVDSGEKHHQLVGYEKVIRTVAFDPTGEMIAAAGGDRNIRVWSADSGELAFVLNDGKGVHSDRIQSISISPNGQWLAAASYDHTVSIWNLLDKKLHTRLTNFSGRVTAVRFSPDGLLATASAEHAVKLWRISDGSLIKVLETNGWTRGLDFTASGTQLSAIGFDNHIRVWRMPDGILLNEFNTQVGRGESVSFSPDGERLASASQNGYVKLWPLDMTQEALIAQGCQWLEAYLKTHPQATVAACQLEQPSTMAPPHIAPSHIAK
ncbi:MAG: AAA-like domain-containing protein [Cyanobacteria bacterium P01_D01_bin.105]